MKIQSLFYGNLKKKASKFGIDDLLGVAIIFVVLGVLLSVGVDILGDVQTDQEDGTATCNATVHTGCGAAYNATGESITAVSKIASKQSLLVTIVIAAIVIGLLITYLARKSM